MALTHDDVITIMYTSGTTGLPKGAMITHGMNFWNAVNLGIPAGIGLDTVHLNVLPLFHTGGLNCYCNPVLHAGGTVVILKGFDPAETLQVLGDEAHGITHFFAVPAPYQFMMQHPDFHDTDLSRLRIAGVGGAPCALTIMETWMERGVSLAQGFGMTETSPACIFLDPGDALRKIGSTGKTLLHTEFRIVNDEGGDCGPDEVGELWVAGPNITPGYWNRPDATADAFEGRWLKTGDAARIDDEGFVYIVDRWKDMYISGGENVYPAEIENVLYQLPEVAEAAIIGVPDDRWGEVGLAVIALKPDATLDRGNGGRALCQPARQVQDPERHHDRRGAPPQRHRQGAQARTAHPVRRPGRTPHLVAVVRLAAYGCRNGTQRASERRRPANPDHGSAGFRQVDGRSPCCGRSRTQRLHRCRSGPRIDRRWLRPTGTSVHRRVHRTGRTSAGDRQPLGRTDGGRRFHGRDR